jgi:GNAT superfamily N-acetyltransferase
MPSLPVETLPLTPERWPDLERVFAGNGCSVARNCWCMYYRLTGPDYESHTRGSPSQARRRRLRELVDSGVAPGLIGYRGGEPVGWISLGPRAEFARLARSPIMKPVDDLEVWSIVCFVVPAPFRNQGVATALLAGAIEYARRRSVRILEAYPVDSSGRRNDETLWFGTKDMYDSAGFVEVARRKQTRPVVRLVLPERSQGRSQSRRR